MANISFFSTNPEGVTATTAGLKGKVVFINFGGILVSAMHGRNAFYV